MGIVYQADLNSIKGDIEQALNKKINAFLMNCYNHLVALSPVDTGRYKNAHHFSINSPSYAMSGAGSVRIAVGEYPTVYLQNNLPYVERIEYGWSKQAPTGVYGNAFQAAMASL